MSMPKPPFELVNHCSAVWNQTLYVYSPQGFASLPLEQDAQWQTLDPGISVTGGQCVPAMITGSEALYIVGGTTNGSAALTNYPGLQRYDFNAGTWETITPASTVTQNRVKHGAAFIANTGSIVVYAGTQDPNASGLGQETFAISTSAPYDVTSYNSQGAPALTSPMLMPWSADQLVLIGGSADNTQVWLFGAIPGWTNLGTSLPSGLDLDSPTKMCTVVAGTDGSRVLEVYDMGVSPNVVTRYALLVNGSPAPVGDEVAPPSATTSASRRRLRTKRDLTIANWPAYNSTLAPTTTRSGFSLAEDVDGLAVISGGNNDDPIALFNQTTNSWQNATSFFVKEQVPLTTATSSLSSSAAATSTAAFSSTSSSVPTSASSGVLGTGQSKSKVLTTLGATLGAILGLAAILIIILLLLRYKKLQQKRSGRGVNEKDQDRLSFADQGADFMKEAGGTRGRGFSGSKSAASSLNSLQIFQNKTIGHRKAMPSDASHAPLSKNKSPLGVSEPLEMSQMSQRSSETFTSRSLDYEKSELANSPPKSSTLLPATATAGVKDSKDGRTRSHGWSRYFANNDVTNLASIQGGARNTYNTEISEISKSSDYSDVRSMERGQAIPPLELNLGPKFEGQRLSAVNKGSPTMGRSTEDIQEGLQAEIRRAGSTSSRGSTDGFELSSSKPAPATQTTYTPMSTLDRDRRADTRSISSNYSGSNPFFGASSEYNSRPRKGSIGAPALPQLNFRNYGDASRDSQASAVTVFPSGIDSPKSNTFGAKSYGTNTNVAGSGGSGSADYFAPPRNVFGGVQHRDSGASDVTVFPGAPASTPSSNLGASSIVPQSSSNGRSAAGGRKMSAPQEMAWLNLDADKAF
ncbi:uncharacterized protein PV09_02408 [Verruconis gallopava]|uniref:Pre-mRNA splicing factor CLF1 n=1 Tax=Verruconis gallopava TaxID=253628 RepID=A0A0D2B641_9PEZI|nr:uncharacterized protein PV09_02408 [Verruconis gallopava]KIW06709.1 hypothetical protein PV09_02408 [Verruconis gallopava]